MMGKNTSDKQQLLGQEQEKGRGVKTSEHQIVFERGEKCQS